jgi:hypothetical protein
LGKAYPPLKAFWVGTSLSGKQQTRLKRLSSSKHFLTGHICKLRKNYSPSSVLVWLKMPKIKSNILWVIFVFIPIHSITEKNFTFNQIVLAIHPQIFRKVKIPPNIFH